MKFRRNYPEPVSTNCQINLISIEQLCGIAWGMVLSNGGLNNRPRSPVMNRRSLLTLLTGKCQRC
jgi:hypothetical protein